jgi:hypothetical protein
MTRGLIKFNYFPIVDLVQMVMGLASLRSGIDSSPVKDMKTNICRG